MHVLILVDACMLVLMYVSLSALVIWLVAELVALGSGQAWLAGPEFLLLLTSSESLRGEGCVMVSVPNTQPHSSLTHTHFLS